MTPSSSPDVDPLGTEGPSRSLGKRLNATFLSLTLVAACVGLWLSPAGDQVAKVVEQQTVDRLPSALGGGPRTDDAARAATPTPTPSASPNPTGPSSSPTSTPRTVAPQTSRGAVSLTPSRPDLLTPVGVDRPRSPAESEPDRGSEEQSSGGGASGSGGPPDDGSSGGGSSGGGSSGGGSSGGGSSGGGSSGGGSSGGGSSGGGSSGPPGGRQVEGCWSFTYQQDAQDYYVADLSDPYGLDGARGPRNGDGLACLHLPIDPDRPRSVPRGAYEEPEVEVGTKAELMDPELKYFGVSEDGIPGDTALMDKLATQVGKAPNLVQWFSTLDEDYTAGKVEKSWARGALPVVTLMPAHKGNKRPWETSPDVINSGAWDSYFRQYARDVVATDKPVVLRFAHEMNGNWYPWSAGGNRRFERGDENGENKVFTSPEDFRQMWRHVWEIFEAEGANEYVIWNYAPVRVNGVNPNLTDTSRTTYGQTRLEDSYPGDRYVDWLGLSAYVYKGSTWTYENTFGRSLEQLTALAPGKRVFVAETGASENTGQVSNTERKAEWIRQSLAGWAADPSVIGFAWFNNTVENVHTDDSGEEIVTDNKWDSSELALQAFREGIADHVWGSGKAPDSTVRPSTPDP